MSSTGKRKLARPWATPALPEEKDQTLTKERLQCQSAILGIHCANSQGRLKKQHLNFSQLLRVLQKALGEVGDHLCQRKAASAKEGVAKEDQTIVF